MAYAVSMARGILVLAAFLVLGFLPARADLLDQEARKTAMDRYPIYQQAARSGDWDAFNKAYMADLLVTQKVFLTVLQYSGEQRAVDLPGSLEAYGYAKALADLLGSRLDDKEAPRIIAAYNQRNLKLGDDLAKRYALRLYPELTEAPNPAAYVPLDPATQKYGEFEVLPGLWTPLRRGASEDLFRVFGRIQMSEGFGALDQGILQEQVASIQLKAARQDVAENGKDPALIATLDFFQIGLDAFRIGTLAELGLLDEARERLPALLAKDELKNYRASVLLSCARTALQQGKTSEAAAFLSQSEAKLNKKFVPPPLRFGLATVGYQVRCQQGYRPSEAQKAADFQQVWNRAFADYRPFERVQADAYWYYARKATRYWLAELDPNSTESRTARQQLSQEVQGWLDRMRDLAGYNRSATPEDWFFNPEHSGNFLTTVLGLLDVRLALVEALPIGDPGRVGFVSHFEPRLNGVEEAAAIANETGQRAFSLTDSGLVPELRGRLDLLKAQEAERTTTARVELAQGAADVITKSGDPEVVLNYLIQAGIVLQSLGRSELAIERWKAALSMAEKLSYVVYGVQASSLLAAEYSDQKKWKEAESYADKAAGKIQDGVVLVADDLNASRQLIEASDRVAEVSLKAAVQANLPEKALAALLRGKQAQSAAAQVRGKTDDLKVEAISRQQREVQNMFAQVEKLERMPASTGRDELLRKTQKLSVDTKAEFLIEVRELRQKYPELYSGVLKFDPLDLPSVQKTLPPEAAVIEYFPTADGLYIFLVTREKFRMHLVPIGEDELNQSISGLVRAVRRAQTDDPKLEADSKALYAKLIEPCQADLEGKSILVLIPTGRLNLLPFGCLRTPAGQFLMEEKLLLELAKPTDFMRLEKSPPLPVRTVVAFANPTGDLPAASQEGEQIAALFPGSRLFKEKQATKQNFLDFGAGAEVLHLATHGESNLENSLTNYLRMSGDEKIAQEEIFGLGLEKTSIVTLSACNTALGDSSDSRFVASLAEAFWLSGSQSVVASLWAVNDTSTGLLMAEFYQALRSGKGKGQALKEAQMKVRGTAGFEHPYYWAGFVLFGDWR